MSPLSSALSSRPITPFTRTKLGGGGGPPREKPPRPPAAEPATASSFVSKALSAAAASPDGLELVRAATAVRIASTWLYPSQDSLAPASSFIRRSCCAITAASVAGERGSFFTVTVCVYVLPSTFSLRV